MPFYKLYKMLIKAKGGLLFLRFLSLFFYGLIQMRHFLYERKFFRKKFAIPCVVSVGNLVAGGVGKTQLVHFLAKHLKAFRVSILSRGYAGSVDEKKQPLLVKTEAHDPGFCGDEPWLLANRLTSSNVIVSKNRFKGAKLAEELSSDVILLDDGMQHIQLYRDFEIVMLGPKEPFGSGKYLPFGMLREDPSKLSKADLVVTIGALSEKDQKQVQKWTDASFVEMKIGVQKIALLNGGEIASLRGKKVSLFCGIGHPERFVATVKELGAKVISSLFLADHQKMENIALFDFANLAKEEGAELLLCTEKDKVKLSKTVQSPLPIGWIETELEIIKNVAAWEKLLGEIKEMAGLSV